MPTNLAMRILPRSALGIFVCHSSVFFVVVVVKVTVAVIIVVVVVVVVVVAHYQH